MSEFTVITSDKHCELFFSTDDIKSNLKRFELFLSSFLTYNVIEMEATRNLIKQNDEKTIGWIDEALEQRGHHMTECRIPFKRKRLN